jgi:hypothetical protein
MHLARDVEATGLSLPTGVLADRPIHWFTSATRCLAPAAAPTCALQVADGAHADDETLPSAGFFGAARSSRPSGSAARYQANNAP